MELQRKPSSSSIRRSDVVIYQRLLTQSFKEIKDVDTIPKTNPVLKNLVSLYIQRTLIGNRPASITPIQQLLDFTGALIGRLPRTDTSKELITRQDELLKQLEERIKMRTELFNEFNQIVTSLNESLKNMLTMLAPQPEAQKNNVVFTNQIKNALTRLEGLNGKIVRENMQIDVLLNKTDEFARLSARISGEPAPRIGSDSTLRPVASS